MSNKKGNQGFIFNYLQKKIAKTNLSSSAKQNLLITLDLVINVIGVIILVIIIRTFIMTPFQVSGISMCNTLNYHNGTCHEGNGDYIIINKIPYLHFGSWVNGTPQRGDVIVFKPPQYNNEFYIKRVIGLPGDTIKLIDGYVYIFNKNFPNGVKLNEPYLNKTNQGNTMPLGGISDFKVPANHYFVLGDNRSKSSDSRLCFKESPGSIGCESSKTSPYVGIERIAGKAALKFWPQFQVIDTANYPNLIKK